MQPHLMDGDNTSAYVHFESAYTADRMPQRKLSTESTQAYNHVRNISDIGAITLPDMAAPLGLIGHYPTDIYPSTDAFEAQDHAGYMATAQAAQQALLSSVTGDAFAGLGQQPGGAATQDVHHQWTAAMLMSLSHGAPPPPLTTTTAGHVVVDWDNYTPPDVGPRFPCDDASEAAPPKSPPSFITAPFEHAESPVQFPDHDSGRDTLGTGEMFADVALGHGTYPSSCSER